MKKCPFCAEEIMDEAIYCSFCGRKVSKSNRIAKNPFSLYFQSLNFGGRFSQREFITVWGIQILILFTCSVIFQVTSDFHNESQLMYVLATLVKILGIPFYIFLFIVRIGAQVRRLHDMGKTGWYVLLGLIPFVNFIFGLVLLLSPSKKPQEIASQDYSPPNKSTEQIAEIDAINLDVSQKEESIVSQVNEHTQNKEQNTKNIYLVFIIASIILISLVVCFFVFFQQINEIAYSSTPTIRKTSTPARTNTRVNPTSTRAVRSSSTPILSRTTQVPVNSQANYFRIMPPSYVDYEMYDYLASGEWNDFVDTHARNLAIPKPYYWEYFEFPRGTRYADIKDYYIPRSIEKGYRVAIDDDDGNGVCLLSFSKGSGEDLSKIIINFWAESTEYVPAMLVFYQNP